MKESKVEKAILHFYIEIYKVAIPSVDFNDLVDKAPINKYGQKEIAFNSYEVDVELFDKIVQQTCKKFKLNLREKKMFMFEAYLGASPKIQRNENP
jgi:hypothetical protein